MPTPTATASSSQQLTTGNSEVDQALFSAAATYGIPPEVMFAGGQVESGLNPTSVGDNGTSFGLYQEHEGGELTSDSGNNISLAENPQHAADVFAMTLAGARQQNPSANWGTLVAMAQRPQLLNAQGQPTTNPAQSQYAAKINSMLGQAGQLPSAEAARVMGGQVPTGMMQPGGGGGGGAQLLAAYSPGTSQADFSEAVQAAMANPAYQSQIAGLLGGQVAPEVGAAQLAESQAMQNLGLTGATIGLGAQNLATGAGYDLANAVGNVQSIGLEEQGLGSTIKTAAQQQGSEVAGYKNALAQLGLTSAGESLQGGYLGQQQGYLGQEQGLANQLFGQQQGYIGQQQGFAGQEYQNTLVGLGLQGTLLGQQEQLAGQGYALTGAELAQQGGYLGQQESIAGGQYAATQANLANEGAQLNYQFPIAQQQQQGQAASQGAGATVGNRQALASLGQNYSSNLQSLGLQGEQAALGYQGQEAGFANQAAQLGFQGQEAALSYAGQQAQFGEQGGQLGLSGQEAALGLTEQNAGFANQLAQLGTQQQQSQLGFQEQGAGLTYQQGQLGLSQVGTGLQQQLQQIQQQSEQSGYKGQEQQYANSMQQLQLAAREAGIPVGQAIQQLEYGLGQLGISGGQGAVGFAGQAAAAQGQAATAYGGALSGASVLGGLSPSFLSSIVGGGSGTNNALMQPFTGGAGAGF